MSGREDFEAAFRALDDVYCDFKINSLTGEYVNVFVDVAYRIWAARDAEIAAKDARIAELEAALYCETSPYEAKTHRCVRCDEEVLR